MLKVYVNSAHLDTDRKRTPFVIYKSLYGYVFRNQNIMKQKDN